MFYYRWKNITFSMVFFLYLSHYLLLNLVNDLLGINCIVSYLGTFMENKTKACE